MFGEDFGVVEGHEVDESAGGEGQVEFYGGVVEHADAAFVGGEGVVAEEAGASDGDFGVHVAGHAEFDIGGG